MGETLPKDRTIPLSSTSNRKPGSGDVSLNVMPQIFPVLGQADRRAGVSFQLMSKEFR